MEYTENKYWQQIDKHIGLYAFFLSALLTGMVWLLRYYHFNPVLFGPDVYQFLTLITPIISSSNETLIRIIILGFSLFCMGLSFFFLTSIAKQYIKSVWMIRSILGLTAITPAFVFGVASFSRALLVLVCAMGILYFFEKKWVIPTGIFALLLGMVSPLAILVIIVFILVYLTWRSSVILIAGLGALGSVMVYFFHLNIWQGTIGFPNLISDFGSIYGTSAVVIILAVLSVLFWDREWSVKSFIILGSVGGILLFDESVLLLFHLILIVLSARTAEEIFTDNWALPTVKKLSILVVIMGILFSTIVYIDRASVFSPTKEDHAALASIEAFTPKSVVVFSSPEQERYIVYYTHRETAVSGEKDREYYDSIRRAAYIKELVPLLEQKRVSVIYFSSEMTQTLPKDERLRFLLSNERFKMIYSDNSTGVWLFESGKQE